MRVKSPKEEYRVNTVITFEAGVKMAAFSGGLMIILTHDYSGKVAGTLPHKTNPTNSPTPAVLP